MAPGAQSINVMWTAKHILEFVSKHIIAEELCCHLVVVFHNLLAQLCIAEHLARLVNGVLSEEAVEKNGTEAAGLDICAINRIAVANNRTTIVNPDIRQGFAMLLLNSRFY